MNQQTTTAIILSRIDYGEADRILTLLTPDQGKLSVLARGVRRVKSKLAGGIELFSTSHVTFIRGRGEMGTLVSARLDKHYGAIVQDLERTMTGYELIKRLHKATEDMPEPEYFELLHQAFEALDNPEVPLALVRFWFDAQLLRLAGRAPNTQTDALGRRLEPGRYRFDFDTMAFVPDAEQGEFTPNHVKFLRLVFARYVPAQLRQVQGYGQLLADCQPLLRAWSA